MATLPLLSLPSCKLFQQTKPNPPTKISCSLPHLPSRTIVAGRARAFGERAVSIAFSGAITLGLLLSGPGISDAKVGVNKPQLLPKEYSPVIDVAGFLSDGQEIRLIQMIEELEKDTGFKLRILAQNFPDTPGLAVKEFWGVDDRTVVFVADPTFGNILHFNVGATVDLEVPHNFWSRVAGKYGNMFYWKEKGEDASVEGAVQAIASCLRDPTGPNSCAEFT